jgi:membrane-associated phospholipid phosphatase
MPRSPLFRPPAGLVLIALAFAAALAAIAAVDYRWTVALVDGYRPGFVKLMRNTVFEGDAPGASDLPLALVLGCSALYLVPPTWGLARRLAAFRPVLGYIMVSGLAAGVGAVHSVKWLLGRPRPSSVLGGEFLPYSEWYRVGANALTDPLYRSSFPSGHTAAACVLLVFVYALHGDPASSRRWRQGAWALGVLVLAYTAAMGIASSMSKSHWLSDAIGGAGLIWLLAHGFYHYVLRVADQRRLALARPGAPAMSSYWELRLCGWGLMAMAGVVAVGLGVRALRELPGWTPAVLLAAGGLALLAGASRVRAILRQLHGALGSPRQGQS